jgi:NRPS condensation-like uncharacterized protein
MAREGTIERMPLGLIDTLSLVHEVLLPNYGENALIHLQGVLDEEVLGRAFLALFREFPICRARIVAKGWRYTFDISHAREGPGIDDVWSYRDLRKEQDPPAADRDLQREFVNHPLRIMAGPQVIGLLVRLGEEEYRLCLKMSHTVFDGVSAMLLLGALANNYGRMLEDPAFEPGEGSLQERSLGRLLRKIPRKAYVGWIREQARTWGVSILTRREPATPYAIQDITNYNPKNLKARTGFEVLRLGETEIDLLEKAATALQAKSVEVCICCILRALYRYNDRRGVRHGSYRVGIPVDLRPLAGFFMEPGNLSSTITLEIPADVFSSLPGLLTCFRKALMEKKNQGQAISSLARYGCLSPFTRGIIWWFRHRKPSAQPLFLDTMPLSYSGPLHKYLPPLGDTVITDIVGTFQLVPVLTFFRNHISFTFPFIDDGRLPLDEIQAFFDDIKEEIRGLRTSGGRQFHREETKITK